MRVIALPHLRNLVNFCTQVPLTETILFTPNLQIEFFSLCRSVKSPIFPLKTIGKMNLVRKIQNCFWLGVVIYLISNNWKVIATCADSYITDNFFSFKRGWIHTRHNCKSSHTHQYTRRQEVTKKIHMRLLFAFTQITVKNAGI